MVATMATAIAALMSTSFKEGHDEINVRSNRKVYFIDYYYKYQIQFSHYNRMGTKES